MGSRRDALGQPRHIRESCATCPFVIFILNVGCRSLVGSSLQTNDMLISIKGDSEDTRASMDSHNGSELREMKLSAIEP